MKNDLIFKEDHVVMPITRKNGDKFEVLLSYESLDKLKEFNYKWYVNYNQNNQAFYAHATMFVGRVDGKDKNTGIRMHRFLMDAKKGDYVDHINHNTLDNRLENLRIVSNAENLLNRKSKNSNNTTGYRNVLRDKRSQKYFVRLQIAGKLQVLGTFEDVHEAGAFAEQCRKKYYKI